MLGPDHKASLNPKELSYLVRSVRNIEKALGDGVKSPTKSEKKNIPIFRKYIVASMEIKKGDKFSNNNITIKRSGKGLEPYFIPKVLGKISKKNFEKDEIIKRIKKRQAEENREDDTIEVLKSRIDVYLQETTPLIDLYKKQNILKTLNGTQSIEDVSNDMNKSLDEIN